MLLVHLAPPVRTRRRCWVEPGPDRRLPQQGRRLSVAGAITPPRPLEQSPGELLPASPRAGTLSLRVCTYLYLSPPMLVNGTDTHSWQEMAHPYGVPEPALCGCCRWPVVASTGGGDFGPGAVSTTCTTSDVGEVAAPFRGELTEDSPPRAKPIRGANRNMSITSTRDEIRLKRRVVEMADLALGCRNHAAYRRHQPCRHRPFKTVHGLEGGNARHLA